MTDLLLRLSPESYEVHPRQVFWLILFRLPSHSTFCVTVAGYAGTFYRIYSCGYSSRFSRDSLFAPSGNNTGRRT